MSLPVNLALEEEPNYRIKITTGEGKVAWLNVRDRISWKRLTAVHHARYYAVKHPDHKVFVHMDEF